MVAEVTEWNQVAVEVLKFRKGKSNMTYLVLSFPDIFHNSLMIESLRCGFFCAS